MHARRHRSRRFPTCITVERASQVGNLRLRGRPACIAPRRCRFFYLHHPPVCIASRRCRFSYLHHRRACFAGRKPAATWSSGVHRSPVGAGFPTCTLSCGGRSPIAAKNPPLLPLAFADAAKVFRHNGEVFRRSGEARPAQAGHRRTRREPLAHSFTTRFLGANAGYSTRHGVFRPAEHLRGMGFAPVFLRSAARLPVSGTPLSCLPATADS